MNNNFGPVQFLGMAIVGLVLLLCYGILPYVGGSALILIDYAAFGFRWFGCSVPWVAWMLLGGFIGGFAGLNVSRRRLGMPGTSLKIVLWGASGFTCLTVMTFLYCHTMKPTIRRVTPAARPAAAVTNRQSPDYIDEDL